MSNFLCPEIGADNRFQNPARGWSEAMGLSFILDGCQLASRHCAGFWAEIGFILSETQKISRSRAAPETMCFLNTEAGTEHE